jgi:hypothetical protein
VVVNRAHRIVRCVNWPKAHNGWQRLARLFMEVNHALWSVRCAPDCPVHPRAEGNQGLPNEEAMAPLALKAIKGSQLGASIWYPKQTKSTPIL